MASSELTRIATLDGLQLAAALVRPEVATDRAVVLVHGSGGTRDEGGLFTRLADGLAEAGLASVRFDLRGHGESEGRTEELTLATVLNDIRVALAHVREATGATSVSLLGASFGGGTCAYYAAKRPAEVSRLVLLNPQLDYKKRTINERLFWKDDHLTPEGVQKLGLDGYIPFNPGLRHGRAIFNEVFWFDVAGVLGDIQAPTLLVHGTADTVVPIESTRQNLDRFRTKHRLVEIDGAQHGFAVQDDPQYLDPRSRAWRAEVVRSSSEWLAD